MTPGDGKARKPSISRLSTVSLAMLLSGILHSQGQEPQGASLIPVSLAPERRNVFWIDANALIMLTLSAERRDLRLVFRDPKGLSWEITAPDSETEQTAFRTVYKAAIEQPSPGNWTLTVNAPEPLPDEAVARLQITYANQVHARMSLPKRTFLNDESLPVSLELMDGTTRVKDLQATVTLTRLGEPGALPAIVTFHDDGARGDRIARDGLFSATIPADVPGSFHLEAQIEGIASTGHFHRTIALTYKVVPKAARITGNITQRLLIGTPD